MSLPAAFRRSWLLYGLVALGFAGAVGYYGFVYEPPKRMSMFGPGRSRGAMMATPVRAVAVKRGDLAVHLRAIGTVTPLNTVTVRSRVDGQLLRINLVEGQPVEAGQLLAEVDPQPFQLKLTQAEARLRQDQAQVLTAKADLERFRQLHAQNLVTQQQLEAQQALVADREGALAGNQAMVEDARRQLAYTKIEAPIAGRLGLRQVDAGNLIRANDSAGLVVITQTRPISVMFTVPEIDLQKVLEPIRAGEQLSVVAWDRNEQARLAEGTLKTIDNQIDLATGTLKLKAEFPNADEKLFPNQFVNIRLHVRTLKDAVLVPSAVVQYGSRGTYVYMVNEKSEATIRDVVLGPTDGVTLAITKGLEGGEKVILEGLDRLREGRPVTLVAEDGMKAPPPMAGKAPGGEKGGDKSGEKGGKRKKKDQ
ncbi:MAG: MdtA/MuxA family multidrug efflux RND transporter periplasmic adaptor subunit [Verrucomicrobia bacterium]|nr:MdtA/MuxA family multidrug efflux RND transporter periplasmic adaptor subunit [Verrucomicrobiota bacterium]